MTPIPTPTRGERLTRERTTDRDRHPAVPRTRTSRDAGRRAERSGYFSLRYGLGGCPTRDGRPGPPPGFAHCHAQLNKDAPHRGRGAERAAPGGPTYHELAVRLAVATTHDAWEALIRRLRATYGDERGERIHTTLAWGR